jgi:hypothetical protein
LTSVSIEETILFMNYRLHYQHARHTPPGRPPIAAMANVAVACLSVLVFALCLAVDIGVADEAVSANSTFSAEQLAFFETNIRPVLVDRCQECHGGEEPESRFSVESRQSLLKGGEFGVAVRPGDPKRSLLISAINHDEFLKMPPKEKLSTKQVVDFTRWVEMGAPWPKSSEAGTDVESGVKSGVGRPSVDPAGPLFSEEQKLYWAFQPIRFHGLPPVQDAAWPQSAIDHFILAQLENAGLAPAPRADKRTLIRRVTFDLIGLPPTQQEVQAFLADDSPLAFQRLVDRLLASPRYGERWGRHWLDVARYADSNGLDENLAYANAFRYRDYVISSFNKDKPYGQFVREQVAGDLLPETENEASDLEQMIATGFLALGAKMLAEDDPKKMQMDIIDEQLSTLTQTFMGLTFGCARCHDHKFDPIPTADYYSLAGIFKSSKTMENHNVVAVWFERPLVNSERELEIAQWELRNKELKSQIESVQREGGEEITRHIRAHVAEYLMATLALEQFQKTLPSNVIKQQAEPFAVTDGYLAIEAEAFHRGNVVREEDGYGEGIGIIATSGAGFVEYDLNVPHAGEYALEARYAAADSRPVKLLVNGKALAESILGDVTGSWFPDTQRWSVETRVQLIEGKNTIRLDSSKVYPHIDKLTFVLCEDPWPFETDKPLSLTHAVPHGLKPALVQEWLDYFEKLATGKVADHGAFLPWLALRDIPVAQFSNDAPAVLSAVLTEAKEGVIPTELQNAFRAGQPASIEDAARAYQELVDKITPDNPVAAEFATVASPLTAPAKPPVTLLSKSIQTQLQSHQNSQAEHQKLKPNYDVAMGVTEGEAGDIHVHLRGNHIALGEVVPRRMPRILAGDEQPPIPAGESGRLQFAQWLADPDHPLVSRVVVNRLWRWRFGRGIVASVDNFGRLGSLPTHPQLLDWLALELRKRRGSLKSVHREILLSSTYQMSTAYNAAAAERDPENQLLWRMNRRRLSGEEVRDSVLQLGPGLSSVMGDTLLKVKNRAYVTGSNTNITDEYDNQRRSVYLPVVRSSVYDVFQTMDFPDPAVANGDRATTTVAPQALMMMNSELTSESSLRLAQRVMKLGEDQRVAAAYEWILGRAPTPAETATATRFVGRSGTEEEVNAWQSFCRVLLSSNEFFYVE